MINVESEPQTGSTFSVYLPAFLVKESNLQKSEEKPAAQKPVKKPAIGTGKILLMDDEEAIRTLLSQIRNVDEITSSTMHHSFRPPLPDLKSQKS